MGQILFFDFCALPIYLIVIYTIFVRRSTKGTSNVIFIFLTLFLTLTTVTDILAECYGPFLPFSETEYVFFNANAFCYLLFRNLSGVFYLLFIITYTRTLYRFKKLKSMILFSLPAAVLFVTLFTNPIHHKVYTISAETGYHRGPLIAVLYGVAMVYAMFGTGYLFFCRRFLEKNKWIALISMYILTFIAVLWQFWYPRYLVEMFSSAIACLMITLLVLRPEEITDSNLGLPSWKAYKAELHKIVVMQQTVQIIVVRYVNAGNIREYLGEENYYNYLRTVADTLLEFFRSVDRSFELFYEAPGMLYGVFEAEEDVYDIISDLDKIDAAITRQTREYEYTGVRLDPRICTILHPKDLKNEDEIIKLGHDFYNMMPQDAYYVKASDLLGTSGYEIGSRMDVILNRAITEKGFEMYYQPIYSVHDKCFRSAEALIRLKDEIYGNISPGLFIPAAERMGLILPIGEFVLEAVFRFIAGNNIRALGLHYIEINLSVAQCLQQNLPDLIWDLQDRYGIDPSEVNFEITETSYDEIGSVAMNNISQLMEMGYSFSLDDYGTGYSNIKRVSRLPLKIIKIDKSLVDDINTGSGKLIIKNVIRMMKDINKELVAEGVETEKDFRSLSEMDCDFIQGYYFSKPLPEKEFINFLSEPRHQR